MEYHKTKDILHVMRMLGHKNIKNTMRYTQLVDLGEQDFVVKVAWTQEEAVKLLEGGFQLVCDYDRAKSFENQNKLTAGDLSKNMLLAPGKGFEPLRARSPLAVLPFLALALFC